MSKNVDWSQIIDLFASEYGWTIEYITNLDLGQIGCLISAINKRKKAENGEPSEAPSANPEGGNNSDLVQMSTQMGGKFEKQDDGTVKLII